MHGVSYSRLLLSVDTCGLAGYTPLKLLAPSSQLRVYRLAVQENLIDGHGGGGDVLHLSQGKQYQLTLELLGATEEEVDDMRMTLAEVAPLVFPECFLAMLLVRL
jgi:hypothetical protein